MKKIAEIMARIPTFNRLPDADFQAIERIASFCSFNKAQIIFSDGDKADGFYAVAQGQVKIFKLSSEG